MAVLNGSIHGFEIKSEVDSLSRLASQAQLYGECLDYVTLVVAKKHIQPAMQCVPPWWGVMSIGRGAGSSTLSYQDESGGRAFVIRVMWCWCPS